MSYVEVMACYLSIIYYNRYRRTHFIALSLYYQIEQEENNKKYEQTVFTKAI